MTSFAARSSKPRRRSTQEDRRLGDPEVGGDPGSPLDEGEDLLVGRPG